MQSLGGTASREGRKGPMKEDMASVESRDQNKGCTRPISDRIHLKGIRALWVSPSIPKALEMRELQLTPIPHTIPRTLLGEASKVWEQLKHGSGSVGEGGPSMPTHLPVSLQTQLRNNQPGTSGKDLLSLGFLCSSVLDGLMNCLDPLLCSSSTGMADLGLVR